MKQKVKKQGEEKYKKTKINLKNSKKTRQNEIYENRKKISR